MESRGFSVETTLDAAAILRTCNLVVTATPSKTPLLSAADLRPGTHITAVGSDTPDKQELDSEILVRADVVVADSLSQCRLRGEIHKALEAGRIREDRCVELGAVIAGREKGRTSESQITVVDLTGWPSRTSRSRPRSIAPCRRIGDVAAGFSGSDVPSHGLPDGAGYPLSTSPECLDNKIAFRRLDNDVVQRLGHGILFQKSFLPKLRFATAL